LPLLKFQPSYLRILPYIVPGVHLFLIQRIKLKPTNYIAVGANSVLCWCSADGTIVSKLYYDAEPPARRKGWAKQPALQHKAKCIDPQTSLSQRQTACPFRVGHDKLLAFQKDKLTFQPQVIITTLHLDKVNLISW